MIWSHAPICYHEAASGVLKPGSSSSGWLQTPKSPRLHSSLCLPELLLSLVRALLVLGTKGWGSGVFPSGGRGTPASPSLDRTLCCIFWSPPSVAAHQEPVQGECSAILRLGRPTSPGNKGLQGLFQTELLLDVRRVWSVQQEVDEGHLSSSRLCGFASPHTLESLLTKISWILLI